MKSLRATFLLLLAPLALASAQTVVPLWSGPAPDSKGTAPTDIPTLTIYLPANATAATPAMIICPGGAYTRLGMVPEGTNPAQWFQSHGIAGCVLTYRLPANGYRVLIPLHDAQRAVRLVRSHAADWKIDPTKVGIMGFSAGGHLASTLETHFDAGNPQAADPVDKLSCRPDIAVLVYPVISTKPGITHGPSMGKLFGHDRDPALMASLSNEDQVTAQTPPTVIVFADNDKTVKPDNSKLMYAALQKAGVVSALQEYPTGGHGFGYSPTPVAHSHAPPGWLDKVGDWLKEQKFMP